MSEISKVDKNVAVNTTVEKDNMKFYDCQEAPLSVHGVMMEGGKFRRLPEKVAKSVSEGVVFVHTMCSGGRVRFKTDSSVIAISVKMPFITRMTRMTECGSAGFDIYADGVFHQTFIPPSDMKDGYESSVKFREKKMRDITINMPLYTEISELKIGVFEDAKIEKATPYTNEKPVVFYGSSITQGGCATRPGMTYPSILSRKFNFDFINLGFAGNAKAEDEIADYIAGLDMSLFVYDYDANSPSAEHLRDTHEKLFLKFREKHPDVPVIIMSKPIYKLNENETDRLLVIKKTYENAIAKGDKNVYMIEGNKLMELCEGDGTIDRTHPTDLGFVSMAKAVEEVMKKIKW